MIAAEAPSAKRRHLTKHIRRRREGQMDGVRNLRTRATAAAGDIVDLLKLDGQPRQVIDIATIITRHMRLTLPKEESK